jgi:DNA primase
LIDKETIDKIFETSRIEEVVGEYVTLKKRGTNLLGLCPFHNEKTPSFTVSPAKGIYKCFGCGKGGNSVNFVMDHEQLTYPEALKYLAKKYNIEIEEQEQTSEQIESQNARESLFVACSFAQKFFNENLHNSNEGKAIGLSYFKERGFRPDIIEKFQLGYSPESRSAFSEAAISAGYNKDILVKAGLSIESENGKLFDRFAGRVMFPVHNVTGRVIAFGGRILKTDKKTAKYINSPETEIYHKSNVLYGAFFAKKAMIAEDNCYLVEGYTDVVSMHQAGIENVVASSGTSLTLEQIRLIRRYTPNVTILYDGDPAGIKASFRGIDLILEEGLNVKVLLFPDGEDPDSFARKTGNEDLKKFIKENSKDFISFKTSLLFSEVSGDPIKRAGLIKDIVESISKIPEAITRSVYIRECSRIMDMEEQVLLAELNKLRRKKYSEAKETSQEEPPPYPSEEPAETRPEMPVSDYDTAPQEKDIIRILLNFGEKKVPVDAEDEEGKPMEVLISAAELMVMELNRDKIVLENPVYQKIYQEFLDASEKGITLNQAHFIAHPEKEVSAVAIDLVSTPYSLSENWEKHGIQVQTEEMLMKKSVLGAVYSLKVKKLTRLILEGQKSLKGPHTDEEINSILEKQRELNELKKQFASLLGRIVLK